IAGGEKITEKMFQKTLAEEMDRIASTVGKTAFEAGRFSDARQILNDIVQNDEFTEFITLPAYDYI
ncbi:MAG: malate synthase A, partial [Bdellovibrionia bacterium]